VVPGATAFATLIKELYLFPAVEERAMPAHDEKRDNTPEPTQTTLPPAPAPRAAEDSETLGKQRLTSSGTAENSVATSSSGVPSVSGLQIGVYEVLAVLGRGGMGVVYRARHRVLGHEVALKMVLAGGHADPQDLVRFRQEAAAIARLRHPGLIHIHDFGEHEGRPFFAMDLVDGGSLAGRLKQGPLPFQEAAALVEKLARAVQHAHERGILHRDLKPGNVLLRVERAARADARSTDCVSEILFPVVTDFGLAKQLNAASSMGPGAQTHTGAILGTPSYMAPEQAAGKGKGIGPATDVYALGAILYECLTGQPPFQSESMLDLLMKVVHEEPTPPRRLGSKCPVELEVICLKCLEKLPERRYPSATAVADDLQRFLEGKSISVRPRGVFGRFGRAVKKHPRGSAWAIGALVALVVLCLSLIFLRNSPMESRDDRKGSAIRNEDSGLIDPNQLLSANKLKQLGLGLHLLAETNGTLPPGAITDPKTGRPLLSWRVAVLPYIQEEALYLQFNRDEPWDSPHNHELLERMPQQFALPGARPAKPYLTYYRGFTGPGTAFEAIPADPPGPFGAMRGPTIVSFTDGTTRTLLLVEAAEPVEWTRPDDLAYEPGKPLPKLGGHFPNGFNAVLADAGVLFVNEAVSEETLRNAIVRNDGNALGDDWPNGPPAALKSKGQVGGRVTFEGSPLTAGKVTLHPEKGNPPGFVMPSGRVMPDGSYHVAPLEPGGYLVTVEANAPVLGGPGLEKGEPGVPPGNREPKNAPGVRIPPKYANPSTSGLRVTVTVGYNTHDIMLTP
jgi:serine/threonine protein kinase